MMKNDKISAYPIRIAATAAFGGFLFGFDMAIINGAIIALEKAFSTGTLGMGIKVSPMLLGAAVGAFFGGQLADRFGRVKCMLAAAVLFFIASFASGAASNIYSFAVWRVLGGIGIGAANIIIPGYIAETAPSNYRGRFGSFQQLAVVVGFFAAILSIFFLTSYSGGAEKILLFEKETWRFMFWLGCIPAVLYAFSLLSLPESPRFLVAKNKISEAEKILVRINPSCDIRAKTDEIKRSYSFASATKFRDLLGKTERGKTRLYPVVLAGIGIAALQQFVGINVIFYYGNVLWQSVGFNENQSVILSVLTGFVNILTTIAAILTIDKIGRKPLLLFGSAGMSAMLLAMTIIFASAQIDVNGNPILKGLPAYSAVISANLFVIFFGMTWGPVMWVMLGEMFSNKIRCMALAVAGSAQWLANFIVSTTFPLLAKNLGLGSAYGVYTFFALFSFFFVFTKIQETKGKELEEM